MIKFFRRIRQKLLAENKISRYLIYAAGEILLVVIGILIALQINTWNEYRKERNLEKEVLQNIVESLDVSLQKMQSHLVAYNFGDNSSNIILQAIDDKQVYHDSLSKYFGWALSVEDPGTMVSFIGYESLKKTGVEIIQNKPLRKEIIHFFEETVQVPMAKKTRMMDYTMELVKVRQDYFMREVDFEFTPFDYDKLLLDQYFYSWVRTIKYSRNWLKDSIIKSIEETERVLQLIKIELDEKKQKI